MGTGQSCVICVADILDCVKELAMKADAMVFQIFVRNLPGKMKNCFRIFNKSILSFKNNIE